MIDLEFEAIYGNYSSFILYTEDLGISPLELLQVISKAEFDYEAEFRSVLPIGPSKFLLIFKESLDES